MPGKYLWNSLFTVSGGWNSATWTWKKLFHRYSMKEVFWKTSQSSQINTRSSHLDVFCQKMFLKILKMSQKKHLETLFAGVSFLKLFSAIFYQKFILHQMITLHKLWKMRFISSKKLFSFSRYSNFPSFPLFLPVSYCFRDCWNINLEVSDVINCLNKNLITHLVWYLEKEKRYDIETFSIVRLLNKEHFYEKIMQKMFT